MQKQKPKCMCVFVTLTKISRSSVNNDFIARGKGRFNSILLRSHRHLRTIRWLEGSTNDVTPQTAAYFLFFCQRSCFPSPDQRHILSHVCPNLIRSEPSSILENALPKALCLFLKKRRETHFNCMGNLRVCFSSTQNICFQELTQIKWADAFLHLRVLSVSVWLLSLLEQHQ